MKTTEPAAPEASDAGLIWTMRIIGVLLSASAAVLLAHDIFDGLLSNGFLAVGLVLGLLTLAMSLMPSASSRRLQQEPVPVRSYTRR